MKYVLYQALASRIDAYHRCVKRKNTEWEEKHEAVIVALCDKYLPSGSGLDRGPRLDIQKSTGEKLVFTHCDFHHMNENGYYDGWTEHTVVVMPSLQYGMLLRITGRNRNDIKDYLHEVFDCALRTDFEAWED